MFVDAYQKNNSQNTSFKNQTKDSNKIMQYDFFRAPARIHQIPTQMIDETYNLR